MGNKETQQAAITHVIALEQATGRDPKDDRTSGLPRRELASHDRVKAFSRSVRSEALPLEHRQVEAAKVNPEHYCVYVIGNLAGPDGAEVGVRILDGKVLRAMIDRSQPQLTYWPSFRASEHDQAERLPWVLQYSSEVQQPPRPQPTFMNRERPSDQPSGPQ